MNTRSLGFRLVAWYGGVLTVVFVLLGLLTLLFLRHYLEANLLDTQARRARQIADTLIARSSRAAEGSLGGAGREPVFPGGQRPLHPHHARGRLAGLRLGRPARCALRPGAGARRHWAPGRARWRCPAAARCWWPRARSPAAMAPRYRVEVGASGAASEATLAHVLLMLAIGLPITVAVAVAGGFVLVRRALKPVEHMGRMAEAITQHNLSERLPVLRSGDELERLSVSLNHMIARLEEAIHGSKQFVADASHELRTPLTVMRGELESLAQDRQLRAETREALGSVLEEVDRLGEIVEGLFALSRLDAGEAHGEWVRFDLAALVGSTAEQMNLLAEDKKVRLTTAVAAPVFVEGDRARLKQVVVNLLDNAIKYTPAGGSVALSVRRDGPLAVFEVSDTGAGIPGDALPHVFRRFYRVDDSRSREGGGAGLGLSIVKSICAAHGASVEVASVPGQGSTFRVRQPLAREGAP